MRELRPYLIAQRTQKEQIDPAIGDAIWRPWKLVNIPFAEEYPGGRQWNHNAAQLVYQPADDAGDHPHWSTILDHCGDSLDPELQKLQWAADAGIASGGDYLKAWIAAMVREPFEPLPYLFFFGPENSGKSIFHEAVALLVTKGVVQADRSLTNQNDFNGELANAVLCVVEEKDIATAKGAYAKIKEWVTAKTISIRRMRTDSYTQPNTTHWVQCANSRQFCPVFPGDTRITMSYVPPLKHEIPKPILLERLKAEAPRFMRTLADLKLPGSEGRLRIPIVATDQKRRAEQDAMTPLEKFLVEHVERVANQKSYLHLNDIREAFVSTLSEAERQTCETDKLRPILERLPEPYELGRDGKGTKIKGVKWRAESEFATAT
ncbi:MAG: hypothetical protein IT424_09405 [Pirellulales bacterium]|nr:hypothetical protein [Pirellulales bacterium]